MSATRGPAGFVCKTCDLDLDIDEFFCQLVERGWSNPLDSLRELDESAPLEAVENLLRAWAETLEGQDRLRIATAREEAIQALQGKVRSPAQLIDAALSPSGKSAAEGPGQSFGLEVPEPWSHPVDGAELVEEISATFRLFLSLPKGGRTALALWVLYAHAYDLFDVSPILALCSPEKRCGKTTTLTLIHALVPKPLTASNITPSALFRAVELFAPTLLIDEADSFLRSREELRGILNSGHTRSAAFVIRTAGDDHEPRRFRTWAPKAVALIGRLPSTLQDRAIVLPMRRKMPGESVERLRLDRLDALTDPLRRKAARWVTDHAEALRTSDPEIPRGLHDRAADNWRPLLALADLARGSWPDKARHAARILSTGDLAGDASSGVALLTDLREIFESTGLERIFTEDILRDLHLREDRSWGEWGRSGKPLSPHGLARLLKPFGIRPRQVRIGEITKKGYRREDFLDAFTRYLTHTEATPAKSLT